MEADINVLPKSAHELIEAIGYEPAMKLFETYGGCVLYIPKFKDESRIKRNQMIKGERAKGESARTLAARYKVALSSVFFILRS